MPTCPSKKRTLNRREIRKKIIDSKASIGVNNNPVPWESKDIIVAKMNMNIIRNETYDKVK